MYAVLRIIYLLTRSVSFLYIREAEGSLKVNLLNNLGCIIASPTLNLSMSRDMYILHTN